MLIRINKSRANGFGALIAITFLWGAAPAAQAEDHYGALLFQNDAFLARDGGGYTNGTYFSSIRVASPGESRLAPGVLLGAIAPFMGVSGSTLTSTSFGQGMVTPKDITRREPDPADAPYVGFLNFRSVQVARQDDTADLVAVNLGIIGPASGAEQTQKFIHRLTGSNAPQGWDSQISNRPLIGLDRSRAWRFAATPTAGTPASDLIVQAGGALSNLESSAGASLLLRYGTGLSRSFPAALGIDGHNADPFVIGEGWFVFAGLSADRVFNHVGLGDEARLRRSRVATTFGLAYGWTTASLTFSVQSATPVVYGSGRQRFGSITYLVRFD